MQALRGVPEMFAASGVLLLGFLGLLGEEVGRVLGTQEDADDPDGDEGRRLDAKRRKGSIRVRRVSRSMTFVARIGRPKMVAGFLAAALLCLLGHYTAAAFGMDDVGAGGGAVGQNDQRLVVGFKADVEVGHVLFIDLTASPTFRCGFDEAGQEVCAGGRRGHLDRHPADETATFYVTEAGDAQRILTGEPPRHVLAKVQAPEAWQTVLRIARPPVPSDAAVGRPNTFSTSWSLPSTGYLEAFWVVENATGARFASADATTDEIDPAFRIDWSWQSWEAAAWHQPVATGLRWLGIGFGIATAAAVTAWLYLTVRRTTPPPTEQEAERHLEALATEGYRLLGLLRGVAGVGGALLLVAVVAAFAGFLYLDPPEPSDPQDDYVPPIGPAQALDALRYGLAAGAVVGIVVWALATWQILAKLLAFHRHMAKAPEF